MCGAAASDFWQTRPSRRIVLGLQPRFGDPTHEWIICDECHEGLRTLIKRKRTPKNGSRRKRSPHFRLHPPGAAICTNCNEGLQNAAPPKADRIHLLSQIRRATIDDQEAVLAWLQQKFGAPSAEKIAFGPPQPPELKM
jgi:hypothetical protein